MNNGSRLTSRCTLSNLLTVCLSHVTGAGGCLHVGGPRAAADVRRAGARDCAPAPAAPGGLRVPQSQQRGSAAAAGAAVAQRQLLGSPGESEVPAPPDCWRQQGDFSSWLCRVKQPGQTASTQDAPSARRVQRLTAPTRWPNLVPSDFEGRQKHNVNTATQTMSRSGEADCADLLFSFR